MARTDTEAHRLKTALRLATAWRDLNEARHADDFLVNFATQLTPKAKATLPNRARTYISGGFFGAGQRLVAGWKHPENFPDPASYRSTALVEARYHPHRFPHWLATIKDPVNRLFTLQKYTETLTMPIFETPEESELVYSMYRHAPAE